MLPHRALSFGPSLSLRASVGSCLDMSERAKYHLRLRRQLTEGLSTGVISSTLVSIGTDFSHPLSTLDKSLITSSTSLFALIASPLAGILADKLGRRYVVLVADVLFAIGASWQALTGSVTGMIMGRSVVGLAIGGASLVTPLYVRDTLQCQ